MAYKRKTWKNDSSTPLNDVGLNDLEGRIGGAIDPITKDTGWVNFGEHIKARRLGNIVTVVGDSGSYSTGPNAHVAVMTEAFRPNFILTTAMSSKGSAVNRSSLQAIINSAGRITVYSNEEQKTPYWAFTITYIVD